MTSSFPQWYAGQIITADALNEGRSVLVAQENDQDVTNSTTYVKSEIKFTPDPNAVYSYFLYLSYSANVGVDFQWNWDSDATTGVLMTSFTEAYATSVATGLNTGGSVVLRRPGNTTNRLAGGTDADTVASPANFHSAYDVGTFITTASPSEHAMYFACAATNGAAVAGKVARIRGGNQTRFIYQRIA